MKVVPAGELRDGRCARLVLEAENAVEEALLFRRFQELRTNPLNQTAETVRAVQTVIDLAGRHGSVTAAELATTAGISAQQASNRLNAFWRDGFLERFQERHEVAGRLYRYYLRGQGPDGS